MEEKKKPVMVLIEWLIEWLLYNDTLWAMLVNLTACLQQALTGNIMNTECIKNDCTLLQNAERNNVVP